MIAASGANFNATGGVVCLVGDSHSCPIPGHGITPIVSGGSVDAKLGGVAIAKNGSVAGCGAQLSGNFANHISIT